MDKKRVSPKRLTIDIPEDIHAQIKIRATIKNISIKTWVMQAVLEKIGQEEKYEKTSM